MTWNSDRVKDLRRRMGWSQSELARRLNCDFDFIRDWEASSEVQETDQILNFIQMHMDTLVLLEKQADMHSDQLISSVLAESFLDEAHEAQVHTANLKRRFFEKN